MTTHHHGKTAGRHHLSSNWRWCSCVGHTPFKVNLHGGAFDRQETPDGLNLRIRHDGTCTESVVSDGKVVWSREHDKVPDKFPPDVSWIEFSNGLRYQNPDVITRMAGGTP
jgi:hypothetical protein